MNLRFIPLLRDKAPGFTDTLYMCGVCAGVEKMKGAAGHRFSFHKFAQIFLS